MKIPMIYFESKQIGDLLQRIEDNRRIETFITTRTVNLIFSIFTIIVFSVVLAIYNLSVFFIFIIGATLHICWFMLFLKKRKQIDIDMFYQQTQNRLSVFQILYGMTEIRQYQSQDNIRKSWEDTQYEIFKINRRTVIIEQWQNLGAVLINEMKNVLITFFTASAVIRGQMTLGMMLSIQYIL